MADEVFGAPGEAEGFPFEPEGAEGGGGGGSHGWVGGYKGVLLGDGCGLGVVWFMDEISSQALERMFF